ncbi:MAG: hypothetical protein MUC63_00060, partial [Planctomycetes bacterium]|nr:hypothetical protein [Planctomycetota bacterium]
VNIELKDTALDALLAIGYMDSQLKERLNGLLSDESAAPRSKLCAAAILGKHFGLDDAKTGIIRSYLHSADEDVSIAALLLVAHHQFLRSAYYEDIRTQVMSEGNPNPTPAIIAFLCMGRDDVEVVDTIVKILKSDQRAFVKETCAKALMQLAQEFERVEEIVLRLKIEEEFKEIFQEFE